MSDMQIDFNKVNDTISQNIELFLDYFNIEYIRYQNRVSMSCPIHTSSKAESLSVFTSGETSVGNFVCWTHHCESEVGRGAVNLITELLRIKNGHSNLTDAVKLVEKITGSKSIALGSYDNELRRFNQMVSRLSREIEAPKIVTTRDYVRSNLTIPAKYYIDRGYSSQTLDAFDVGFCNKRTQQMYMRVVVPVYDITGKFLIGCVGRTINEKCHICNKYHYKNNLCPSNPLEEKWANKWINSDGFRSGNTLYNIWNAATIAQEKQKLILVEGQGDVWRLWESGIKNCVGLFGCKLTDSQFDLIESIGITDIYLALDSDTEGVLGRERIYQKLKNYYNVHNIDLTNYKDVGEMSIEQTQLAFNKAL